MVLMLSWSMTPTRSGSPRTLTAWRSPGIRFDSLTFAPAAGRRTPADRSQILDAPRNATDQEILRQNETACSFGDGMSVWRERTGKIVSIEQPTSRGYSARRRSMWIASVQTPAELHLKSRRYKAHGCLSKH